MPQALPTGWLVAQDVGHQVCELRADHGLAGSCSGLSQHLTVQVFEPQESQRLAIARAVLPKQVPMCDAVFNLGRAALVVQALQKGDLDLLAEVMDDRLHQPYRLKLIAGAEQAIEAARRAGAAAVALSGAGPSLIAFPRSGDSAALAQAVQHSFAQSNIKSRAWPLSVSPAGASAQILEQTP